MNHQNTIIRESKLSIGYWLDMEIYTYEFWCGVILRDVRTTHQNDYIYFHIQPITFLLHTRYYHSFMTFIMQLSSTKSQK